MLTGSQCLAFPLKISKCTHVKLGIPSVLDYIRTRTLTTAAISYTNKSGNYIKLDDNVASGNAGSARGWESKIGTLEVSSETVTELVSVLSPDQRGLLLEEIHKVQATDVKRRAEEKLASWRWRSRFGRPTSVHQLGADPTGTYCEIPQDWLQKKVAEKSKPQRPTGTELRHLAVFNALPFIGFGFLDNLIMIVAGDYIDVTIGMGLGISTMAAAALGNTVSDLAGIGSAWYVENIAVKIGMRAPNLCQEQLEMMSSRWSANIGRGVGVVLGCLLGMFPLLFLNKGEELKKDASASKKDDEGKKGTSTETTK